MKRIVPLTTSQELRRDMEVGDSGGLSCGEPSAADESLTAKTMAVADEYRANALGCDGLANAASNEAQKLAYLNMARMWRRLAHEVEDHERRAAQCAGLDPNGVVIPFDPEET